MQRQCIGAPERIQGYDAIVSALADSDPAGAIRGACAIQPSLTQLWKNLSLLLVRSGRWDEVGAAVPRRPRPLPACRHHPVDLDAAIARYRWLMRMVESRGDEGWAPSRVEGWKRGFSTMDRRHLANFRRSELSGGTQEIPDRPADFPPLEFGRLYPAYTADEREASVRQFRIQFHVYLTRLLQRGAQGINWYDDAVLDDDRFGARLIDLPGIGPVTSKSIQSAYYASRIMSLVPRNGVVLEIGSGFGAVASRLLAIRPGPRNRAIVVPPWRLASLPLQVDLAVNTMGFQHMDERNHAFYGDVMRRLGTRRLYHVNRNVVIEGVDTMVVPADRYSFMADYRIVETRGFDEKWIEVIAEAGF